jgi:hypothetical protein
VPQVPQVPTKQIYFDPSETARPFTIPEMAFVLAVLNDNRAWDHTWTLAETRAAADWIVALEDQTFIERRIAERMTPSRRRSVTLNSGLSVTFMRETPRRSLLSFQNWSTVPRPVAGVYSPEAYRTYLVLHECGHALGLQHSRCRSGSRAPVMMQQTRGLRQCTQNPWPLAYERSKLRRWRRRMP